MLSPGGKLPHVQGVRGIAIISVVLFHFFPQQFSNGFLSVDMFFLLSGYLMTMMLSRHDCLHFSVICDFWYRRVKRIVPLYYVVVILLLVLLRYSEVSMQSVNVESATIASIFATNLVRPKGMEGYFEKLGVAIDLFTHTWSLAVEMQFYVVFPFMYTLTNLFSRRLSFIFLYAIALVSFAYCCSTDEFTSFNSLLSRIWQFTAGILSYMYVNKTATTGKIVEKDEEALIETQEAIGNDVVTINGSLKYCLGTVVVLLFFPTQIDSYFSKFVVTVLTMVVLQHGGQSVFLKNQLLVLVGEISYSWYLVHWPIAAYIRFSQADSMNEKLTALVASFLFATVLHLFFERVYLKWEKATITAVLAASVCIVCTQIVLFKMDMPATTITTDRNLTNTMKNNFAIGKDNYPSDFAFKDFVYGYEDKTKDERFSLNAAYQENDIKISMGGQCQVKKKTSIKNEQRCEMNKGVNPNSPYKLLVVGNSWAGNIMSVLSSECRHNFSHIEFSFTGGCEVLVNSKDTYFDCSCDYMFFDAVKEIKPDVLFIVQRHIHMMNIENGTNPFDDEHFRTASNRLVILQKYVSRRIFILDAFPEVETFNIYLMNALLRRKEVFKESQTITWSQKFLTAKVRLARLIEKCPKCRLFDFAPQFYIDGKFRTYDPKYFVSFFTMGLHLTPPGWERVRPLFSHLCNTF